MHLRSAVKKILRYLLEFFRRDGVWIELLSALALTAGLVYFNESHGSEKAWLKSDPDPASRLLKYLALYGTAFGGAYGLQALLLRKTARYRNPHLWALIALAVLLFALRAWVFQYGPWLDHHVPIAYHTVATKYCINAAGLVLLGLPVAGIWWGSDRKRGLPLYGFHARGVNLKPYFVLLTLMLPLLFWAAQQPDFQQTYPRAEKLFLPPDGRHNGWLTALYEVLYSLDFVTTEFFFRGFLILHFARFAGARSVLPMCVFYVTIHFDKPLAEALSSFFGGLILGVLALETRSIYGGIIVHLGIALLMEVLGFMF